jgi:hypothetical protein
MLTNEATSADGGCRATFAFLAQWPAAAKFCVRRALMADSSPRL